jgi:hypothetical protein
VVVIIIMRMMTKAIIKIIREETKGEKKRKEAAR